MKPVPAIILGNDEKRPVFLIREISKSNFDSEFHFHEECQLAYIIKGSGKRIVGDSIEYFAENDLVFLGPNVPHVWYNAGTGVSKDSSSVSLSLFISPTEFNKHLAAFGETQKVEHLFNKARRGMLLSGQSKKKLITLLSKAAANNGISHLIHVFKILEILVHTNEYTLLTSSNYVNNFQYRDNERMDKVYQFLLKNFKEDIQLKQVADVAGMNPNSFCRYFKSRTQKSCTLFINEIRIGYASKLLGDKNESISQIAYECGFNNISNFNRSFKMIKKISPSRYRKELEFD